MSQESKEAENIVKELINTLPKEWKGSLDLVSLRNLIRKTSRELPADFYQFLKEKIFSFILKENDSFDIKLKLVIDSNIIIKDSFRVAKGMPSTTLRLFQSPFVELIAPKHITDEVYRQIKSDIPPNADLSKALSHARNLLNYVTIVEDISVIAAKLGSTKKTYGNDMYFLALAITSKAKAIVSYDKKAFEGQPEVRRWEMNDVSEAIVSLESGILSFSLFSFGIELTGDTLKYLIFPLLAGIAEIFKTMTTLIAAGVSGILAAFEKVPTWFWIIILIAMGGILITAALDEDFRNKIGKFGESIYSFLVKMWKSLLSFLKDLIEAIVNLIKLLMDTLEPYFITFGSAVFLTLTDLLAYIKENDIDKLSW
ncbi:MAG: PIN domain-containing protein [Candidatus Bathyarchaeia archaeon]